jgi:hypothetical protein
MNAIRPSVVLENIDAKIVLSKTNQSGTANCSKLIMVVSPTQDSKMTPKEESDTMWNR